VVGAAILSQLSLSIDELVVFLGVLVPALPDASYWSESTQKARPPTARVGFEPPPC
jgi:hypothetical protein